MSRIQSKNISKFNASVSICTYNRAELLKNTLKSLVEMYSPEIEWELLLVDNNSTDATKPVAQMFSQSLPLRYFFEKNQGLSYARNRAISECRSNLLLFTDDDMLLSSCWLQSYVSAARNFPDADYFGGKILPRWPDGRPLWLKDEGMALLSGLFGYYNQGDDVRMYDYKNPTPFGGNFGLRRSLFENLEPFCVDLGVSGNRPGRGEETEYLSRARSKGYQGAYVGNAECFHLVNSSHLRLNYLYRFGIQKGVAEMRLNCCRELKGSFRLELNYAVRGLWQLAKGRGDRFRQCVINMGIQAGLRRAFRKKRSDHFKKCL